VADGAPKPTKVKRTYDKAVLATDDKETALPVEKKTVLIEKKNGTYSYTVDGKDVGVEVAKLLDAEFNTSGKDNSQDIFFPKKTVKPGETWKIDTDALAKALAKQFKFDESKFESSGKLTRAYKQDGARFGVFEIKVTAPITDLGQKMPVTWKNGTFALDLSGDGVIDGTSSQGKSKMVMKVVIEGSGKGFDLRIEVSTTENRTHTPVK
jgi:hypothetical protein